MNGPPQSPRRAPVNDVGALFEARRTAWLAADADAYLDLFDPALVIEMPSMTIEGRDRYAKLVAASFAHAQPVSFEFHHLVAEHDADRGEDVALADWTITVARRDTGAVVSWDGLSSCRIRDGRITWWREFHRDPAALAAAMR